MRGTSFQRKRLTSNTNIFLIYYLLVAPLLRYSEHREINNINKMNLSYQFIDNFKKWFDIWNEILKWVTHAYTILSVGCLVYRCPTPFIFSSFIHLHRRFTYLFFLSLSHSPRFPPFLVSLSISFDARTPRFLFSVSRFN